MRQVRWASWMVGLTMAVALGVGPAAGGVTSDEAAAIVKYPDVFVWVENAQGSWDTVIQLSNTSLDPVLVKCFYENANYHCSNDGTVCVEPSDCCDPALGCGICVPGWNETDFWIRITPRQPLGWLASQGLKGFADYAGGPGFPPKEFDKFPIGGFAVPTGLDGSSNVGSRIPPVAEDPFDGSLKCIAVNEDGTPTDRNVLKGETTLVNFEPDVDGDEIYIAKSNAVGIQAIEGAVNDDNTLVLGGPGAEYEGCPNYLIVNHFFDLAINPVSGQEMFTYLVLVPCTQDLLRQIPGATVVQYLVYNEFEQRFSTSRSLVCKQGLYLSDIDTTQPERSIFSAGVAGTLTGQSRLNPLQVGLVGVALEEHGDDTIASYNIHQQGDRADSDIVILP